MSSSRKLVFIALVLAASSGAQAASLLRGGILDSSLAQQLQGSSGRALLQSGKAFVPDWLQNFTIAVQGKCVDVPGNRQEHDQALKTFVCNGTPAQQWTIAPSSTKGWYKIMSTKGFCMGLRNGAVVVLGRCSSAPDQDFDIFPRDGGLRIRSTPGKCVSVTQSGELRNTPCSTATSAQGLQLRSLPFNIRLMTGASYKCVDIPGNRQANDQALQMFDCNNTPAQQWTVVPRPGRPGWVKIMSSRGLCMGVRGSSSQDGAAIVIGNCNYNRADQDFSLPVSAGWIIPRHAQSKMLYIMDWPPANGSPVSLRELGFQYFEFAPAGKA